MTQVPEREMTQELLTVTIDGFDVAVPTGTLVIRAAELIGVQIPRFCDHPLLAPVGACRQCLVEVEGQRKPLASCTTTVTDGMVVHTQVTSEVADKAQKGVMELLLINHPLDCPVCDKGGECPLQNQAMSNGRSESRFDEVKRTFPKPISLSSEVLLDRERCVLCARCTRFSQQIAGDPFIELMERGALQQVGIYAKEPFESYFSGNTVQICPVGALTGAAYRFRARPFDLISSPSVCEHCASGCAQRTDHRRGKVLRRLAGDDPQVNEEWNCDKGRWAFSYATQPDRITTPLIRRGDGRLASASWSEALTVAARGLSGAIAAGAGVGVLVGGRATLEDAYAYSKFARVALGTNDIDFRSRVHSGEEAAFLAARVAGRTLDVTYDDLEKAPVVLLAGFEPEEESPIVFLRLRKAARKYGLVIHSIAPYASRGLDKMSGRLLQAVPGAEPEVLDALCGGDSKAALDVREPAALLRQAGAVILVGERMAGVPGGLSAALRLATVTGARLAWVPRRAGERGALEAGALPNLLPGGRPVTDPRARRQVASLWNVPDLPDTAGRGSTEILAAVGAGQL
ncbi:MAG: NADH-quinone oxidoreductase subunit G, partial [Rhodococcus sp. (in: high G+C Gram-positive bacteria)]|uniref:NADH-quinone oxidoreductase subunit G n=1 Tax=Rhodococcus sp. TaxID=1831 RepID=UPI003BAF3939